MISFTQAYVSNGQTFASLEEAQAAELIRILVELLPDHAIGDEKAVIARHLVQNKERVIDILTTNGKSRPRARKVNGGRKPRNVTKLTQTEMAAQ